MINCNNFLTLREAAKYIGISKQALWQAVQEKRIFAQKKRAAMRIFIARKDANTYKLNHLQRTKKD